MADDSDDGSTFLTVTPRDRDAVIRTVLGEAANQGDLGQAAVAHVIMNRAIHGGYGGSSPAAVVMAPGQFEPNARGLYQADPATPAYQSAAKIVDGVLSGDIADPTNGATMFLNPGVTAARSGSVPAWAQGPGIMIGDHVFSGGRSGLAANTGTGAIGKPLQSLAKAAAAPSGTLPAGVSFNPPGGSGRAAAQPPSAADMSDDDLEAIITGQAARPAGAAAPAASGASPAAVDPLKMSDDELEKLILGGGALAAPPAGLAAGASPNAAQHTATPIGVNDAARAVATGVPIIGGVLNKADAALNAALAPIGNRFFAPQDQLKGDTFGERYANSLRQQEGMDADFAREHPVADKGLGITGAVLGTAAAMRAAPAAFGISRAGLGTNMLLGGTTGGAIGGADAAVRSGGNLDEMKRGAVTGTAFGAAGPFAGAALGSTVNKLLNFAGRTTPAARNVAGILSDAGMTPAAAQNALLRTGPAATLADIDPALTTEAGGLAALGGQPTSILKNAMAARAAGADNRVAAAVDQALGPKPDLEAALAGLREQGSHVAGPHYDAARTSASPMDISHIVADIDQRIPENTGGVAATLRTLRDFLTHDTPLGRAIKDDPQQLLNARRAMDDLIERRGGADTTAGRNALRQATDTRGALDAVLKSNADIAAGDAAYASHMNLRDAMQDGTALFQSGARPEAVRRMLQSMSPAEVDAYRAGARVAIGDALEQARRGELAGAQSMFGRASANRAKLDMLFPQAGEVFDMLQGEAAMRATERSVAANSTTAERRAVQQKYQPQNTNPLSAAPAVIGEAIAGGPGALALTGARAGYNALTGALGNAARDRLINGTAAGLAATGPEQQAFFGQVARASRTNGSAGRLTRGASAAANLLTRSAINPLLPQPARR